MITLQQVEKVFQVKEGKVSALQRVDLRTEQGEFFVLLGPSGSGKTTLLRCVGGLEKPEGGEIYLGTRLVYSSSLGVNVPPEDRDLGMVFQSYAVWPHMTVFENVALPLTHGTMRLAKPVAKERVARALALVKLEGKEERPVPLLSGGEQQRVALARALAIEPVALLMDEPLSNLDARLREEVRSEIRAVSKMVGVTVLYVTHDQGEAMALADRIAVMDAGQILQVDSPSTLYEKPANPMVAEFFGSINWLGGEIRERGKIETGVGLLHTDCANNRGAVQVGIRPESLLLTSSSPAEANVFRGRILEATFLGDHQRCKVRINSEVLFAKVARQQKTDCSGRDVYIHFPKEDLLVFPKT